MSRGAGHSSSHCPSPSPRRSDPDVLFHRDKPVAPSNVLSMAQLRSLPLADQIRILMKNGGCPAFAPPPGPGPAQCASSASGRPAAAGGGSLGSASGPHFPEP